MTSRYITRYTPNKEPYNAWSVAERVTLPGGLQEIRNLTDDLNQPDTKYWVGRLNEAHNRSENAHRVVRAEFDFLAQTISNERHTALQGGSAISDLTNALHRLGTVIHLGQQMNPMTIEEREAIEAAQVLTQTAIEKADAALISIADRHRFAQRRRMENNPRTR
jgi:hypothetical protein